MIHIKRNSVSSSIYKPQLRSFQENFNRFGHMLFLTNDAKAAAKREKTSSGVEIYPGIFSYDPKYLDFLGRLSHTVSEKYGKTKLRDDGLFDGPPIATDFTELRTVAGSIITPLSYGKIYYTRLDNNELNNQYDNALFDEVIRLRYSEPLFDDGVYARVSVKSTTGIPFFTSSTKHKLMLLQHVANNIGRVIELFKKKDLRRLAESYGIYFVSHTQIRKQVDTWRDGLPRRREILNILASYHENGKTYTPNIEDVSIRVGHEVFSLGRTRTVNALSSLVNNILSISVDAFRRGADKKYAFTYKHTTSEDIINKLNSFKYIVGLDVSAFDRNVPEKLVARWLKKFPFVMDVYREMTRLTLLLPHYTYERIDGKNEPLLTGDPFSYDMNYFKGVPSGFFATSMIGKDIMTFIVLNAISKLRSIQLDEVDMILRGEHKDIGLLNQGDDCVLMTNDLSLYKQIVAGSMTSEYMDLSPEQGTTFLGLQFYRENNELKACHSMSSYLAGAWVPERSYNTPIKPYGIFGKQLRRQIFMDHPYFPDIAVIESEVFKKVFGENLTALEDKHVTYPPIQLDGKVLTAADIEVLTDFSKLFYKYEQNDVSDEVMQIYSASVGNDITQKILNAC